MRKALIAVAGAAIVTGTAAFAQACPQCGGAPPPPPPPTTSPPVVTPPVTTPPVTAPKPFPGQISGFPNIRPNCGKDRKSRRSCKSRDNQLGKGGWFGEQYAKDDDRNRRSSRKSRKTRD